MAAVGYSGAPLAKKLGVVAGSRLCPLQPPVGYAEWLAPLPEDVVFDAAPTLQTDIAHLFVERRADLQRELLRLRGVMRGNATLWVSWPKKASKRPTDITEDTIREVALPLGLVDVKVCAISEVWSGLRLVVRKELR